MLLQGLSGNLLAQVDDRFEDLCRKVTSLICLGFLEGFGVFLVVWCLVFCCFSRLVFIIINEKVLLYLIHPTLSGYFRVVCTCQFTIKQKLLQDH